MTRCLYNPDLKMSKKSTLYPILTICIALLTVVGCADKNNAANEPMVDANPLAAYAGDWMTEAYVGDAAEPATVVLLKATDDPANWGLKFTHLDDAVMAKSVTMVGDTVVMAMQPFLSSIQEGVMVDAMTSYMKMDGDKITGRARAVYSNGDVVDFRLASEKVQ
jgi:hypothetical protein